MSDSPVHFDNLRPARFIDRPNQFLARCRTERGGIVRAFLPNPGRMLELLFPDVTVYLTEEPRGRRGKGVAVQRKTRHTVVAVERDGSPVFLHTQLTNRSPAPHRKLEDPGAGRSGGSCRPAPSFPAFSATPSTTPCPWC